ncbi:MAG: ATP-binding cassette domain-containing protein [Planctomycetota bacterium]
MTSQPASFTLQNAAVGFNGTAALAGIDLEVRAGECVGLVGPSGAGKTTLLRLLNGTLRPSDGTAAVDGRRLASLSARQLRRVRSRVGFIHQDLSLVPNLRVVQNVLSGRMGRWGFARTVRELFAPGKDTVQEVHELLERVGIGEKLFERTDTLSGGQRQRVAIARALYQQPGALLADEPVSSVDPARARDTVSLLRQVSEEAGITLCVSLHNLELAREFFPRLVGLRRGRIVFDKPTGELSDPDFAQLFTLSDAEILADGDRSNGSA